MITCFSVCLTRTIQHSSGVMQTHSHGYKFVIINIIDVIMVAIMTIITIIIILMKNSSDRLGAELQSDNGGPALGLC